MSWDNLKTVQAVTEETLWQEDRKMHSFFFHFGIFLFLFTDEDLSPGGKYFAHLSVIIDFR